MFVRNEALGGEFSGEAIVKAFLEAIADRKTFNETGTRWEGETTKKSKEIGAKVICRDSEVDPESFACQFLLFSVESGSSYTEARIGINVPPGYIEDRYASTGVINLLFCMLAAGEKTSGVVLLDEIWETYQIFLARFCDGLAKA